MKFKPKLISIILLSMLVATASLFLFFHKWKPRTFEETMSLGNIKKTREILNSKDYLRGGAVPVSGDPLPVIYLGEEPVYKGEILYLISPFTHKKHIPELLNALKSNDAIVRYGAMLALWDLVELKHHVILDAYDPQADPYSQKNIKAIQDLETVMRCGSSTSTTKPLVGVQPVQQPENGLEK